MVLDETTGHQTTTTLKGCPLKPTALKGPFRAAYEAITNSRFGVLEKHEERLGRRLPPNPNLGLSPARVNHSGEFEIFAGAAWLRRYDYHSTLANTNSPIPALKYKYGTPDLPADGEHVKCWIQQVRYYSGPRNFPIHVVRQIVRFVDAAKLDNAIVMATNFPLGRHGNEQSNAPCQLVEGYVFISNRNMIGKHDERVFFNPNPTTIAIDDDHKKLWHDVIKDYDETNRERRARRNPVTQPIDQYIGDGFGAQAFSWHLINPKDHMELKAGTMCYAKQDAAGKIIGLYPVSIARELMEAPPIALVHESLKPATDFSHFSPADRVFGWVNKKANPATPGRNAYKGQLRIASITCGAADGGREPAVATLAILASPKPQQSRFYGARDLWGLPIDHNTPKNAVGYGHTNVQGLRGRKVYLHQPNWSQGANASWRSNIRDKQNRSITDWVKPGTKFTAKIQVTNLNKAELGALLWLLDLGQDGNHFLKIGGGKPLGFGSVKVTVNNLDLRDGAALRADFKMLNGKATEGKRLADSTDAIDCFRRELTELYCNNIAKTFDEIRFIKAFKRACTGPDDLLPVAYPWAVDHNNHRMDGNFAWFVENERDNRRLALPPLWELAPLPVHAKPAPQVNNPRNQGHNNRNRPRG